MTTISRPPVGRLGERAGLVRRRPGAGGPPPTPPVPPSGPRWVAANVLAKLADSGGPALEEAFEAEAGFRPLAPRDRAMARLLVLTVLRRQGQLDALLARFVESMPKAPLVPSLLRLGAAQLVFLGTPAHAALNETVRLAVAEATRFRPLLNAVLRRVAAVAADERARLIDPAENVPPWLWASWCEAHGTERAAAIALAQLAEPPLDLSVKADPALWAERLGADLLPNGTLRRPARGLIDELPGFAEGAWWVQDVAASLPVALLGAGAGDQVVDLCAAPGGKTMQLAAKGAAVTAVELRPERIATLRANLERTGLGAEIVEADAGEWRPAAPVPFVLLDAPCTATGTIRRHPDVPFRRQPGDAARTAEQQERLLRHAASLLAPGGRLIYAVCSLQPEEGAPVVERVLADTPDLERLPIAAEELMGLPLLPTAAGDLRTFPSDLAEQGGMDGFYIARLRRR